MAHSLDRLPDAAEAAALLAELATAPCPFGPVVTDRPLALYGAGNLGRLAREFLNAVGRDFRLVVDRDAARLAHDPYWSGVRLLHPDEVPDHAKDESCLAVSIATAPYVPLERSLTEQGFRHVVPFYDLAESFRHLHPLSNGWFAPPLDETDRAHTAKVLAGWDDDVSRAHHLQFLAWRRLRAEWTFQPAPVMACARFFIPEIASVLHGDETFVDAGAHHGSVVEAFTAQTGGKFRQIFAIEPDPDSRAVLEATLRSRATVLSCALSDAEGGAPFHHGLGYASQISETGRMRVEARPLDALGLSPSFIKLHLEGHELAALKGARRTLLAHRPMVAATVYHNADGIWRTARWLMETLPDYRMLFRLHSWCGTGAVIYAIPRERTPRA